MIHESIDKKLSEWLQEKLRTQAVQTKEIEKLKASLPKTLLLPNNNNMYSAKRSMTPYTYLQSKLPIGIKSRQNTVAMINCQNSTAYNTKEIVLNKVEKFAIISLQKFIS
ncbi:unnamed protein product [Schistosoma curassoni]|uniref:Uncharacterized protein n=1 Tax=Schistosoma curassoni TaxID=6186 RepID=A0A183KU51_9TREM|nr:unnamed protein product [Schistosoma curassoni]